MMKQVVKLLVIGSFFTLGLSGCKKEVSLEARGIDRGQGVVKDFNFETNVRVALIDKRELEEAKSQEANKKPELTYGAMDVRFVTLDDVTYMVHWNDDQDFRNIKRGEKVNFRASEYVGHTEKDGQNYKVIFLHEL